MTPDDVVKTTLETIEGLRGKAFPLAGLKNAKPPFSFYLCRTQEEEEALDGWTGLREARFELNFVAANYAEMVALSVKGCHAFRQLAGTIHGNLLIERAVCTQDSPDLLDQDVNLYRRRHSLQFDYQEVTDNE